MQPQSIAYGDLLARNLRAARAAANLSQTDVGERMGNLGFTAWMRSTVSLAEQGKRRVTAEEVFALSYVLETTILRLVIGPTDGDERITFPAGTAVDAMSVIGSARGSRDGAVRWDGNSPVFRAAAVDLMSPQRSDSPDG
jgi:transcriptional regulator with XRE-family HTH domain